MILIAELQHSTGVRMSGRVLSLGWVSGLCLWGVSLGCVSGVCLWVYLRGVSLGCVSGVCLWGVLLGWVSGMCLRGASLACVSGVREVPIRYQGPY